jgi:hypothetical protein
MRRLLAVINVTGLIVGLFGIALMLPIVVSWTQGDGALTAYGITLAVAHPAPPAGPHGARWLPYGGDDLDDAIGHSRAAAFVVYPRAVVY